MQSNHLARFNISQSKLRKQNINKVSISNKGSIFNLFNRNGVEKFDYKNKSLGADSVIIKIRIKLSKSTHAKQTHT